MPDDWTRRAVLKHRPDGPVLLRPHHPRLRPRHLGRRSCVLTTPRPMPMSRPMSRLRLPAPHRPRPEHRPGPRRARRSLRLPRPAPPEGEDLGAARVPSRRGGGDHAAWSQGRGRPQAPQAGDARLHRSGRTFRRPAAERSGRLSAEDAEQGQRVGGGRSLPLRARCWGRWTSTSWARARTSSSGRCWVPMRCPGTASAGVHFAVWAPGARRVSVVGDFNHWDGRRHPMRRRGSTGVWETFLPGVPEGARYKFELRGEGGDVLPHKADPVGFGAEHPPATASVVRDLGGEGLARRRLDGEAWRSDPARPPRRHLRGPPRLLETGGRRGPAPELPGARRGISCPGCATWASPTSRRRRSRSTPSTAPGVTSPSVSSLPPSATAASAGSATSSRPAMLRTSA